MEPREEPSVPSSERDVLKGELGLPQGWGEGRSGRVLFWIAVAFSTFQIAVSLYAILPTQVLRAMHVGFLVLVAAALLANHQSASRRSWAIGWAIGLTGFGVGIYHWIFYYDLVHRASDLLPIDIVVGVVSLVVLFAVAWRLMGAALPVICLAFVGYALLGQYLPRPFDHRGYGFEQVIEHMAFGTEGIYATPAGVSATYIYLFVLFGAFLERAGMIQFFNDVALGLFGAARGGPAKVAVFSSAMMGTISGSGVANVVTVGQFTIPLMKRYGYEASFAGGVEATASMGGQIMPPVMGAVAFIMAENIGVPYATIVQAAIIPAILYFASAFWMVHLEALKRGLRGMPRAELPSPLAAVRRSWHLVLPVAVLVYLLMTGYTPLLAGSIGLALTAVMILGSSVALGIGPYGFRVLFWIALGLVSASFLEFGIAAVLLLIAALIAVNLFGPGGRETLRLCRDSLAEGARYALPVGIACAIVGTVMGTMTLTGVATILASYIVSFGRDSLFLCLVLIMTTSIILGTGLPTIPTYIITASLAAPALYKLGVPLIVSHMFVFYYGIIADLTPPVALAALAAAPIARASPDAIGWQASRIALAGFLIPFLAVYEPSLMLQSGGAIAAQYGYWVEVVVVCAKAAVVIAMSGIAAIGFCAVKTTLTERILAGVAAGLLIAPMGWADACGLVLAAVAVGLNFWRASRVEAAV